MVTSDGILVKINKFDENGKDYTPTDYVQFPFPKEAEQEIVNMLTILHSKYTKGDTPT